MKKCATRRGGASFIGRTIRSHDNKARRQELIAPTYGIAHPGLRARTFVYRNEE